MKSFILGICASNAIYLSRMKNRGLSDTGLGWGGTARKTIYFACRRLQSFARLFQTKEFLWWVLDFFYLFFCPLVGDEKRVFNHEANKANGTANNATLLWRNSWVYLSNGSLLYFILIYHMAFWSLKIYYLLFLYIKVWIFQKSYIHIRIWRRPWL